jgi:hypothetical protein
VNPTCANCGAMWYMQHFSWCGRNSMARRTEQPMPKAAPGPKKTSTGDMARSLDVGQGMVCESIREKSTARSAMRKRGWKVIERKESDGWYLWRAS